MSPRAEMSRGEWLLLAAIVAASVAIVGSRTYLPMNDASSHLATAAIAVKLLQGDPFVKAHYYFVPVPVPYWAATLLTAPLIPLLGATKAFVAVMALYVVLLPIGFYFLMRVVAPENVRLTAVAALTVFNWAYWLGEANFLLGQIGFLFALGFFLRIPSAGRKALVGFLAAAAATYAGHIFAVAALAVAIAALVALDLASRRFPSLAPWRLVRGQWTVIAILGVVFVAGAYFVLIHQGGASVLTTQRKYFGMMFDVSPRKLVRLAVDPFHSPTLELRWPSVLFSIAVGLVLVGSAWRSASTAPASPGLLTAVNPALLAPALTFVALFYILPVRTTREGEIAQRFVLLAFLLCLGAIRLRPDRRLTIALAAIVAAFAVFKLGDAWRLHRQYDAVVTELSRNLLSQIPEESRVVPIRDTGDPDEIQQLYHRLANYVVVERHGYSSNILATPGQQALRHAHAFRPRGHHRSGQRSPGQRELDASDWEYFDYALVQAERDHPDIPQLEERATLVAKDRDFQLYRIRHEAPAAAQDQ